MTTYLDEWGLTAEDDALHPATDDPWWTETWWNAWFVPERRMIGYFYPVLRPNLGVQAGGVVVYDDTAEMEWDVPVFDYDWHQPIPLGLDLRDAKFANGMTIRCLDPGRRYELGYTSRDLELRLEVTGVVRPLVTNATPPFNKGHIDQICHMSGEMVLAGETIPVDCLAMRDRSWGPRQDGRQPTVGYNYAAADADNAFLAVSISKATDVWDVTTGFLVRDGVWGHVTSGRRDVERDARGRPVTVTIDAADELGRTFSARGVAVNHCVFKTYPSMLCWNSLMDWECDGWRGWGEDQDCWHPRRWRSYRAGARD
ncbi:MAG: hypothetical protein ACYDH6_05090 [Acidimicrobiales bacterium]